MRGRRGEGAGVSSAARSRRDFASSRAADHPTGQKLAPDLRSRMMRCQEFEEQLPDYLHQSLDPEEQRAVEDHLDRCGDCREQVALWKKLSLLPEEKPTAGLRARFEAMLAAYQQGQETKQSRNTWAAPWRRRAVGGHLAPLAQAALVIVLVGLGFAGGRYASGLNTNNRELTSLHQELAGLRQLVVLSLL